MGDVLLPGGVEVSDAQLEALRTLGQQPQGGSHSDVTLALAAQKADLDAAAEENARVTADLAQEAEQPQPDTTPPETVVVEVPAGTPDPAAGQSIEDAAPADAAPSDAPASPSMPFGDGVDPSPAPATEPPAADSSSSSASTSDTPGASPEPTSTDTPPSDAPPAEKTPEELNAEVEGLKAQVAADEAAEASRDAAPPADAPAQ